MTSVTGIYREKDQFEIEYGEIKHGRLSAKLALVATSLILALRELEIVLVAQQLHQNRRDSGG